MDRFFNSKSQKEKIYAIYKGCRLCGAGGGFKMPIIQNVVDLDENGVELRQKIRECVQIEVQLSDRMPPLICELCIDKINDFHEFLMLCQQTDNRTRMQLGLPPQQLHGAVESDNCILGLTEPVFIKDEDEDEPLSKQKTVSVKAEKKTKEVEKKKTELKGLHKELQALKESLPVRDAPAGNLSRTSRGAAPARSSRSKPDVIEIRDTSPPPAKKRARDADPKPDVIAKKLKFQPPPPKPVKPSPKSKKPTPVEEQRIQPPPPKPAKPSPKSKEKPKPIPVSTTVRCEICSVTFKNQHGLRSHRRSHVVTYTEPKLACNACGSWFSTQDEAASHHRKHKKTYECTKCYQTYTSAAMFDEHLQAACVREPVLGDAQCALCWRYFVTDTLRAQHRCLGAGGRPGNCKHCDRTYQTQKTLRRHESTCRMRGDQIDPEVKARLKPLQIRMAKCDPLLEDEVNGHYDVSRVPDKYGLDRNCVYPYTPVRVKREYSFNASDGMVNISDDFRQHLYANDFVHWDSDTDESDQDTMISNKTVQNLSTLSLKTIFSNKCLGKVPRKRRKVKPDSVFNSIFNESKFTKDINNIISNLGTKDDSNDSTDSMFGSSKNDRTDFNADFDSLFNNGDAVSNNSEEQSILKDFVNYSNIDDESTDIVAEDSEFGNEHQTNAYRDTSNTTEHINEDTNSKNISVESNKVGQEESENANADIKSDSTSLGEGDDRNESESIQTDSKFIDNSYTIKDTNLNIETKTDNTTVVDEDQKCEPEFENTDTKTAGKLAANEEEEKESESQNSETKLDSTPDDDKNKPIECANIEKENSLENKRLDNLQNLCNSEIESRSISRIEHKNDDIGGNEIKETTADNSNKLNTELDNSEANSSKESESSSTEQLSEMHVSNQDSNEDQNTVNRPGVSKENDNIVSIETNMLKENDDTNCDLNYDNNLISKTNENDCESKNNEEEQINDFRPYLDGRRDDYGQVDNKQENAKELDIKDDSRETYNENSTSEFKSNKNSDEDSRQNGNDKSRESDEMDDDKLMDEINKQIGESRENSEGDMKNTSGDKITLEDLIHNDKVSGRSETGMGMELDNISDDDFNFDS